MSGPNVRTLALRLNAHEQSALRVAEWLEQRPEVVRVLHPALPSHPQHALFKRDFSGSCGLFSFQLSDAFSAVIPLSL
ncbi:Cys/Met metabolism PLP-dependent enzyme-domain-containing protein [Baffinella frigidus]|nr:Cys/Met metabolism PLP-dependent enzyme-domain-containing protein [Cryptophyta sp. CCMP2293]